MTWRAVVRLGAEVFTHDQGDPPPEAPAHHLTSLTRTETLDDGAVWPAWRTWTCEVGVVVSSWADLPDLGKGSLVSAWWGSTTGTVPISWRFDGIATDVDVVPHPLGVLVTVTAVDHRTAALDIRVDVDRNREQAYLRLGHLMGLTGLPWTLNTFVTGYHVMAPVDESQVSLLDLVKALHREYAANVAVDNAPEYTFLSDPMPVTAREANPAGPWADEADGGELVEWEGRPMFAGPTADSLPGYLGVTPGVPRSDGGPGDSYGVTFPTGTGQRATTVVPAGYVDLASKYTDAKGGNPNTVVVKWAWDADPVTYVASTGETPQVVLEVDTTLNPGNVADPFQAVDQASVIADLYLPRPGATTWHADDFRWFLGREDLGNGPVWVELGALVAVAPILDAWTPTDRPWYVGALVRTVFTVSDGEPQVLLRIAPRRARVRNLPSNDYLTPAVLAADFPALTVGALNGRDTVADWELLRGDLTP